MIWRIEALQYRCLRYVRRKLCPFQVLVGPNASGKKTFLDTVRFLGQLVSEGLASAIHERSENLQDLVWGRRGSRFELAIEIRIPEDKKKLLQPSGFDLGRYEVSIGIDPATQETTIFAEKLLLAPMSEETCVQRQLFPFSERQPETILRKTPAKRIKTVIHKVPGGTDHFYDETGKGWDHAFRLGVRKSALANLPEDDSKFPVATWVKKMLSEGIDTIALKSASMRKPSAPGQTKGFKPDGSNLPWVIENMRKKNENDFSRWIAHVQTALPDLKTIHTLERSEDRHRFLEVVYQNGLHIPSWGVSDGTLRLLALTLLAYSGETGKIYLVEEPENGIHPLSVGTVFQSLSSPRGSQILCASQSPVILSLAEPDQVLCFAKTPDGATDIVRGDEHPKLRDWKRDADLGTLFAAGVLG
jgi:predicted ATPase